jgi:hypothetical protein
VFRILDNYITLSYDRLHLPEKLKVDEEVDTDKKDLILKNEVEKAITGMRDKKVFCCR